MNKAFVREPDPDVAPRCPTCGTPGLPVSQSTLDHFVANTARDRLRSGAYNCNHVDCDVIYFNEFNATIRLAEVNHRAWPYHPDAPVCPCFGVTYDDIARDADAPEPLRIRELVRQSKTPAAQCSTLAVDGQCCLKEVQRLYFRLRAS